MDTITIEIRSVYGNQVCYPVCDKAKAFANLAGKKTLDAGDFKLIRELGFDLSVKASFEHEALAQKLLAI